jgi:hypothetical protein
MLIHNKTNLWLIIISLPYNNKDFYAECMILEYD